MNRDDMLEREYRDFVEAANRELLPDDEYGRIAACDALTAVYGLDRGPNPKTEKQRGQAATAAQCGGFFHACGGDAPCRE